MMHHEPLKNVKNRRIVGGPRHGEAMIRVGKKKAGRLLDGAEHNAMPALPAYTPKGTN